MLYYIHKVNHVTNRREIKTMTKQEFIEIANNFAGKARVLAHNVFCNKCNYMQDIIYPMSMLSEMVTTVAELQNRTRGSFDLSMPYFYISDVDNNFYSGTATELLDILADIWECEMENLYENVPLLEDATKENVIGILEGSL